MTDKFDAMPIRPKHGNTKESIETFTARDSTFYDISKGIRLAIVFNYYEYKTEQNLSERFGTERDVQAIQETFKELNFETEVLENPTQMDIIGKLESIQERTDISCLAIFILGKF